MSCKVPPIATLTVVAVFSHKLALGSFKLEPSAYRRLTASPVSLYHKPEEMFSPFIYTYIYI